MAAVRRRAPRVIAMAAFASILPFAAFADAGWFEAGDTQLRMDLQLLNDSEVIRMPVNQWPIPRESLRYALGNAKEHFAVNAAVIAALGRVRQRIENVDALRERGRRLSTRLIASAGESAKLREFDELGRENGELTSVTTYVGDRAEVSLRLTGVVNPSDDRQFRADGSHATVEIGNWLVSAHTLERFWGPSHESSLILSNNARPMPTLMVERAAAMPFESRWLSWLGPWRMSFGVGRMEERRQDIDAPLFLAWRVTIMPFQNIELGLTRTAQFCGKQLECNFRVFGNLLAGNDNVGIDATPENEPGNQMAGFDIRWSSPIGSAPYAVYSQFIGEDESSYLPAKYLGQFGIETWKTMADGGLVQVFAEYSNTTCSGLSGSGPYYNCAYTQGRFSDDGYRYYERVMGHTADSDAETYALGATYLDSRADVWSTTLRTARLNHDGEDTRNTVSGGPAAYRALELGWRGRARGQLIDLSLGAESYDPEGGDREVSAFGFVRWTHDFSP